MPGLTASPQDFVNRLQEIEQIVDTSDLLLNDELQATQKWGFLWIVRVIAQPFFCCCDLFADVRIAAVSTEFRRFLQRNKTFHFAPGRSQELSPQATMLSQRIVTKLQERSHHRYDALIQRTLEPFTENDPEAQPRYFRDQVQDDYVRHMRDLGDIRNSATETLNDLLNDNIRLTRSARQTPPSPASSATPTPPRSQPSFFAHNNMEDPFAFHFEMPPMPEMPSMGESFTFDFQMPSMPEANVFSNRHPSDWDAWDRAFDEWDRAFTSNWNHAFRDSEERLRESEERVRQSREAADERIRQAEERVRQPWESVEERIRQAEERREATAERLRQAEEQLRQTEERCRQEREASTERVRATIRQAREQARQAREARNASSSQQPSAPRPSASTPGAQQPSAPRATPSTEQAEQQERRRREEEAARERARFENLFRPGSDRVTSIEAELCRLFDCQQISSAAELSSAFRRWSRSNHPDRVPPERQQEATALFQQVSEKVAQLRTARQWT